MTTRFKALLVALTISVVMWAGVIGGVLWLLSPKTGPGPPATEQH